MIVDFDPLEQAICGHSADKHGCHFILVHILSMKDLLLIPSTSFQRPKSKQVLVDDILTIPEPQTEIKYIMCISIFPCPFKY